MAGPTCEVLLEADDSPTLYVVDAVLATYSAQVKGLSTAIASPAVPPPPVLQPLAEVG